jgi:lipopolysaccharide exporter
MSEPEKKISSSFSIDVAKLVTGTSLAQVIILVTSPVLTRLYGPEAFGFLALFTSITGIIGVIVCLRYENTIILPKDDREAANLLGVCVCCVVLVTGLTITALYFGGNNLEQLLNAPGLGQYLILVPPFVFVNGIFLSLNYWNSRTKHFGTLSVARVTSAVTMVITQVGAGVTGYATGGSLIVANLAGSTASTGLLCAQTWRDDRAFLKNTIDLNGIVSGLKRYKKFPLITGWTALLNMTSWQLPVFLFSTFFSPEIVGYYSLGMRSLQLPMNLIGGAIGQVFFQRAAEAYHQERLSPVTEEIFTLLLTMIVFPMVLLGTCGQDIYSLIFGSAWAEAGLYAQILSIWAIFWFIYSPLSIIALVKEKLTIDLNINILIFIVRLTSLVLGGLSGSVHLTLAIFSIFSTFIYGFGCFVYLKLADVAIIKSLKLILRVVSMVLPFIIPVIIVKILSFSSLVVVVTASVMSITYYFVMSKRDPIFRSFLEILKPKRQ